MSRFLAGTLLLLFAGMAGPIFAGTVYVPVITSVEDNGVFYETRISISNSGPERAEFTVTFLDVDTNGTQRADNPGQTVLLNSGGTFQVTPEDGFVGLVEVTGDDSLIYDARIVGLLGNQETLGEQVQVISSRNLANQNTTAYLQGLLRDPDHLASFGIVNLGQEQASCSVDLLRKGGSALVKDVLVPVKPLSHVHLGDDVLGLMGHFEDVRAAVTCPQPFYTYSATFRESGEVAFVRHSGLGSSTLLPPGAERTCPDGSVCFQEKGIFHSPTPGNLVRRLNLRPPAGEYSRVQLTMEVIHGGWSARSSGTHNIFWFVREKNKDMFGYVNVQGPNKNEIFLRHGFNLPQEAKPKLPAKLTMNPGEIYRFEYTFDTASRFIELLVFDQGGQQVMRIQTVPNVNTITFDGNQKAVLDFGFDGSNPNEPATIGWGYKDLFIEFVPR